jgi:hypothetical protein
MDDFQLLNAEAAPVSVTTLWRREPVWIDPLPLKWSALRYGFEAEEDRDGEQETPA